VRPKFDPIDERRFERSGVVYLRYRLVR